jgi:hypothetical protein
VILEFEDTPGSIAGTGTSVADTFVGAGGKLTLLRRLKTHPQRTRAEASVVLMSLARP